MKLYEFPPTRSIRARWALQEAGAQFDSEIVDMLSGAHRSPEFLAINPAGKLPVLVDGDFVLTESLAIVVYVAERFPQSALIPPDDPRERAQIFRWMLFAATELEQPLWRIARHTSLYEEADRIPKEIELAERDFKQMAEVFEAHIDGREFVAADAFTAADIICGYTLDWANEIDLLSEFPAARNYMTRLYRRPNAPLRIAEALASVAEH